MLLKAIHVDDIEVETDFVIVADHYLPVIIPQGMPCDIIIWQTFLNGRIKLNSNK